MGISVKKDMGISVKNDILIENDVLIENNWQEYMKHCTLCPRNCGVDRLAGVNGYCGAGAEIKAARAALHMWEEPCISGKEGSGAIFFSGCSMRCVFCQNHDIALAKAGMEITVERLSEIMMELQEKGANNINLVTPTHYVPQIVAALKSAKSKGLSIPVVYNSSGYEKVETLKLLEGYVDIYLPDCKYYTQEAGSRYANAADYFSVVVKAIAEMLRQVKEPSFDERGMMKKGVIIRHLLLPGKTQEAIKILKTLYQEFGDCVYFSIMNQYTVMPALEKYPELGRKVTDREYDKVVNAAIDFGIENGFIQEGETQKESFIPMFDGEGIIKST